MSEEEEEEEEQGEQQDYGHRDSNKNIQETLGTSDVMDEAMVPFH